MADHMSNALAVVCSVGGVAGYVRGKSVPSLVAGLSFGALYAFSGNLIKRNADYGHELALGTSLVLMGAMGPRALKTKARAPVGLFTLGSLGAAYFGKKLYQQTYGV
ncbi:transmembrane proteins 14C-domain-containing protein [Obelidium mucronatum]|nr:transmembrane proteins 14C-domain-containing protein [Obelidium mucronatum]